MKIFEVAGDSSTPSPDQLLGLVQFLAGRAEDTSAPKQISVDAFVNLAQSLDINVNKNNVQEIVGQPPLSSVLEPFDPSTNQIVFKGAETASPEKMPVNKAQDIVAAAAKSAMKRNR
jgi:hypothetical protein